MSFSSNIQKILSSDNIIRKEGEFIIQQQLDLNFLSCLNNCCDILTNEIEDQKVRQFCATFIKNILSKEEYITLYNFTYKIFKMKIIDGEIIFDHYNIYSNIKSPWDFYAEHVVEREITKFAYGK